MKDNKLIGDFMDIRNTGLSVYKESAYKYHESWDWLMPVIEKIENDGLDPHGMIDNSLRKNNQKRWRSIEDLHNVAVYLINIYNNEEKESS
jgi:hypothetical protein